MNPDQPLDEQPTPAQPASNIDHQDTPAPPAAPQQTRLDPDLPEGDQQILVIRRHPFGLVAIYLQAIFGVGITFGLLYFLLPTLLEGEMRSKAYLYLSLFGVVVGAIVALILMAATFIYRRSRWIVTQDSIHQVLQRGLFNHQSSELSLANIEDVTAEQNGILAELFGFGALKAETAGELPYFHFNYCPTPDKYAKIILATRERFLAEEPGIAKRTNDLLDLPGLR